MSETLVTDGIALSYSERLRDEANIEPDAPVAGSVKKETQIIAIYGDRKSVV